MKRVQHRSDRTNRSGTLRVTNRPSRARALAVKLRHSVIRSTRADRRSALPAVLLRHLRHLRHAVRQSSQEARKNPYDREPSNGQRATDNWLMTADHRDSPRVSRPHNNPKRQRGLHGGIAAQLRRASRYATSLRHSVNTRRSSKCAVPAVLLRHLRHLRHAVRPASQEAPEKPLRSRTQQRATDHRQLANDC